jgi:dolichyl-phosphate-mannose--protein O-mannosyl transferase
MTTVAASHTIRMKSKFIHSIYNSMAQLTHKIRHLHSENKVVYEEWLLSFHGQKSVVRRSWGLLGLKVKEYDEETEYWDIEPELRSQSELKAAHENAASSTTESKYRSSIDKAIKALPQHARDLIDWLVEECEVKGLAYHD